MDWLKASAMQQGRAIMAGVLDPLDQTEAYLAAAKAHPDCKRIYARLTEARARSESVAAHDRAKEERRHSLLDGVAIAWKDNIDSGGTVTEAGSKLLEGRVPRKDAIVLARLARRGMVCLGKTHLTELAFSGLGLNPVTATPPNALDPELAPGGSSSGSAVAVALGLAAAAIGTDTGGSVRVPAAWNGLVGFKPTNGAVPEKGVVPLCRRFDVAGPIARTVEDCAELFALMADQRAPDLRDADVRGRRFLVLDGLPFDGAEAGPVAAFEDALARLAAAGAQISHVSTDWTQKAMELSPLLFAPEAYGIWRAQIEDAPELMWKPMLDRFRGGADVSAPDYVAAWESLDAHPPQMGQGDRGRRGCHPDPDRADHAAERRQADGGRGRVRAGKPSDPAEHADRQSSGPAGDHAADGAPGLRHLASGSCRAGQTPAARRGRGRGGTGGLSPSLLDAKPRSR